MKMRVAKLVEVGKLVVEEAVAPEIADEYDVQVQVKTVGICGTDLHIFKEGRNDVELPRVMGHELAGVVTAVGEKVDKLKIGDRVVLDPVFACGECPTCKKGYPNVCEHVKCYGVQMDGGYQDYIVVHQKHLYKFADTISFKEAALAEPFSIAANILDRVSVSKKDNVLIMGAGTIGLAVTQCAVGLGARVMVMDIMENKLQKAKDFGAEVVVNSGSENVAEAVQRFSPGGVDVVIDAVGVTPLFQTAVEYVAPRARIACIGFDSRATNIAPVVVTKKELSVIGSRMNCMKFPQAMEWLEEGKIQADKMISAEYSIENIQQAFEETIKNSRDVVKTLICF